jgi:uncharacterized protein (DUF305 family)
VRRDLGILSLVLAMLVTGHSAAAATGQAAPIFQPGAPGQPSRIISAEAARDLGRTTFSEGDVRFMQHMIVHHGQAVEMVDLLKLHGADPTIARLGLRIAMSQEAEMELMRRWLTDRGQSETAAGDHAGMDHGAHGAATRAPVDHSTMDHSMHGSHGGHGDAEPDPEDVAVMAGMLTPRQMRTLAAARGAEFDRLFLTGMIQHHQGALDMVDDLMAQPDALDDTMLSEFANSVIADQSAEILRMQSLLSDL